MALSFETLRDGDEQRRAELGNMAFGKKRPYDERANLPNDRFVAVYDGNELVASSALVEGGHWFGGRPVDGPAISGVSVAPHRRGTGIAKPMLREVVNRLAEEGAAISGLYPTAAAYYRGGGWEIAGDFVSRSIDLRALADVPAGDVIFEAFEIDDLASVAQQGYDTLASLGNGHVVRGDRWWWFRQRHYRFSEGQGYLLRATDGVGSGHLVLHAAESKTAIADLTIDDIGATSAAILRSLGRQLRAFGTVAGQIRSTLAPSVLQTLTEQGQQWKADDSFGWMLRIVDIERAFAQRGWPVLDAQIKFDVVDPILATNTGGFLCTWSNGECTVERVAPGHGLELSIQALASWYTGWRTPAQLLFDTSLSPGAAPSTMLDAMTTLTAGPACTVPEFY